MSADLALITKALRRIADAQEAQVKLHEKMLKHVTRPRQLFADYDAGVAVAKKERAALAELLYESLKYVPDGPLREQIRIQIAVERE